MNTAKKIKSFITSHKILSGFAVLILLFLGDLSFSYTPSSDGEKSDLILLTAIGERNREGCEALSTFAFASTGNPRRMCYDDFDKYIANFELCEKSELPLSCLGKTEINFLFPGKASFCNELSRRLKSEQSLLYLDCSRNLGRSAMNVMDDNEKTIEACLALKGETAREYCIAEATISTRGCKRLSLGPARGTCYYRMAQHNRDEITTLCKMFTRTIDGWGEKDCMNGTKRWKYAW